MSKLQDRVKGLNFDEVNESEVTPAAPGKPRTGVGVLTAAFGRERELKTENDDLKNKLARFDDAVVVEFIDPARIRPSRFANRHELSFVSIEFTQLREEIESAGRNVQPIKVRKVGQGGAAKEEFEIVFGHRRHRACLELGIPVAAIVADLNDQQLFAEMERENRSRKNLSAWEQGVMYRKALDEGLYSSMRRLSEALKVNLSDVSRSVSLARLPDEVVAAFQSPLDIQFRWAAPLAEAMQKNPVDTLKRAHAISKARGTMSSAAILAQLVGVAHSDTGATSLEELSIAKGGKVAAVLTSDSKGRAVLRFEVGALPVSKRKALAQVVRDFLDSN
ncbi:MAG: ParB/RepB/Spo0J family partition protein [Burkholderiales bacterium]|nr:ParB/RepB/Spo0J family partition protein [Burkholderiales bacterium]